MPLPSRRVGRHRRRQPSRMPGVVAAASLGAAVIGGLNVPQAAAGRDTSVEVPLDNELDTELDTGLDAGLATDEIDPATVAEGVRALTDAARVQQELAAKAALAARADAKARADRAKAEREKAKPDFVKPVRTYRLSSDFGYRSGVVSGFHTGVDLAAPIGTPVYAVGAGTVIMAGRAGGYGNRVVIRHHDNTVTYYAHLNSIAVDSGAVEAGTLIGEVGTTGHSTGPHLHLEVRPGGGEPIDPEIWLAARDVTF